MPALQVPPRQQPLDVMVPELSVCACLERFAGLVFVVRVFFSFNTRSLNGPVLQIWAHIPTRVSSVPLKPWGNQPAVDLATSPGAHND